VPWWRRSTRKGKFGRKAKLRVGGGRGEVKSSLLVMAPSAEGKKGSDQGKRCFKERERARRGSSRAGKVDW